MTEEWNFPGQVLTIFCLVTKETHCDGIYYVLFFLNNNGCFSSFTSSNWSNWEQSSSIQRNWLLLWRSWKYGALIQSHHIDSITLAGRLGFSVISGSSFSLFHDLLHYTLFWNIHSILLDTFLKWQLHPKETNTTKLVKRIFTDLDILGLLGVSYIIQPWLFSRVMS